MLEKAAWRDLRSTVASEVLDDAAKALGRGAELLAAGDVAEAVRYFAWAKSVAPRAAAVREALGIALYHGSEYAAAARELEAYRRMSGARDQNHVLADCLRAAGRLPRVVGEVEAMEADPDVAPDRVAEGRMVLAAALADDGQHDRAWSVLARSDLAPVQATPWHPRVWSLAAAFARRDGEEARERDFLEAVVAVDPDFPGAAERLDALGPAS